MAIQKGLGEDVPGSFFSHPKFPPSCNDVLSLLVQELDGVYETATRLQQDIRQVLKVVMNQRVMSCFHKVMNKDVRRHHWTFLTMAK